MICRHGAYPNLGRRRTAKGEEPGQIADLVEEYSAHEKEVWVFAHNLAFDLTVSQLPAILAARGWSIDAYGMSKESNWWVLKRDGRKVIVADSWSWLPESLETLAHDIGRRKVPLPGADDSLEQFHKRCARDASILADLLVTVMDWWDENALGKWSITGAGCGWQAMRTKTGAKRMVVGPDGIRTKFEREAIYGGRKEVFQVGEINGEWCADYDFQGAYPTIAAHYRLPILPLSWHEAIPEDIARGDNPGVDFIARCQVVTERPVAPARIAGDVWWPVGRFNCTLTGPEARYAQSQGAQVTVGEGWTYKMDYALRPWAMWCLSLLHAPVTEVPALVRRMAKGWSRSVIGRFGGHTSQITTIRPAIGVGVRLTTGHNLDTGRPMEILTIGDRELTTEHDLDGSECFPAVLAFVEGHCRVALGEMIDSRRPCNVLQVNTDGWWERRVVRDAAYVVERPPWPHTVIRKAIVSSVLILGPDHLRTPNERRLSGVPKGALGGGADEFVWHDWPGMRWQWERNANGEYVRPHKALTTKASYARRWVLANGETVAIAAECDQDGTNYIEPWSMTPGRRNEDTLAEYQDERLSSLRGLGDLPPVIFGEVLPVDLGRKALRPTWATLRGKRRIDNRITHNLF